MSVTDGCCSVSCLPQLAKQAHAQGTGRHSKEDVEKIGRGHLQALSDFLRDKPYFFGNEATLLVRVDPVTVLEGTAEYSM